MGSRCVLVTCHEVVGEIECADTGHYTDTGTYHGGTVHVVQLVYEGWGGEG